MGDDHFIILETYDRVIYDLMTVEWRLPVFPAGIPYRLPYR